MTEPKSHASDLERRMRDEADEVSHQWPDTADVLLEAADALARLTSEDQDILERAARCDSAEAHIAELERELDDWRAQCQTSDAAGGLFQERAEAAEARLAALVAEMRERADELECEDEAFQEVLQDEYRRWADAIEKLVPLALDVERLAKNVTRLIEAILGAPKDALS